MTDKSNAKELANIAREIGAEVIEGRLSYSSETGGYQLGQVDLSQHLDHYREKSLIIIVAPIDKELESHACGICGLAMDEVRGCPRCRLQTLELAAELEGKVPGLAPRPQFDDAIITASQISATLETIGRIMVSDGVGESAGHNASWYLDAAQMIDYWWSK